MVIKKWNEGKIEHNGETTNRVKDCKTDREKQIERSSCTKVKTAEQIGQNLRASTSQQDREKIQSYYMFLIMWYQTTGCAVI